MNERRRSDRRERSNDSLMSDSQVAEMAGVPVNTVRKWRQTGTLPFVKVGRHPRIWLSVFQKVFHKPPANAPLEFIQGSVKIQRAGDIRRKL